MTNVVAELGSFLRENQDKVTAFTTTTGTPILEVASRPDVSPIMAVLITAGGITAQTIMNYVDMAYAQYERGKVNEIRSELASLTEEGTPAS